MTQVQRVGVILLDFIADRAFGPDDRRSIIPWIIAALTLLG